jgi:hypothetical protein
MLKKMAKETKVNLDALARASPISHHGRLSKTNDLLENLASVHSSLLDGVPGQGIGLPGKVLSQD